MQIAVYPGSFDPLHIGHLSILRHANVLFDKVLLVVSPQNPFKPEGKAANSIERLEKARKVIASQNELAKVEVSDIEFTLPSPQYTFRTMNILAEKYKELLNGEKLTLIIGADNLVNFHRWAHSEELLLNYKILVFPREGTDAKSLIENLKTQNPKYEIELAQMPEVKISSTQIRQMSRLGEDISQLIA